MIYSVFSAIFECKYIQLLLKVTINPIYIGGFMKNKYEKNIQVNVTYIDTDGNKKRTTTTLNYGICRYLFEKLHIFWNMPSKRIIFSYTILIIAGKDKRKFLHKKIWLGIKNFYNNYINTNKKQVLCNLILNKRKQSNI